MLIITSLMRFDCLVSFEPEWSWSSIFCNNLMFCFVNVLHPWGMLSLACFAFTILPSEWWWWDYSTLACQYISWGVLASQQICDGALPFNKTEHGAHVFKLHCELFVQLLSLTYILQFSIDSYFRKHIVCYGFDWTTHCSCFVFAETLFRVYKIFSCISPRTFCLLRRPLALIVWCNAAYKYWPHLCKSVLEMYWVMHICDVGLPQCLSLYD